MSQIGYKQAFPALDQKSVVYLDGTRYYSPLGQRVLKPRGRYGRFELMGESFVFRRSSSYEFEINGASEIFGADDVWWMSDTLARAQAPSVIAPWKTTEKLTAAEWWQKLDHGAVVLDFKIIMFPRGSEGGGRGRTDREAAIRRERYTDEAADISMDYLKIAFSNERLDGILADYSVERYDDFIVSEGGFYDDSVLFLDSPIWQAGDSLYFSKKELVDEAAKLGMVGPRRITYEKVFDESMRDTDVYNALLEMYAKQLNGHMNPAKQATETALIRMGHFTSVAVEL